MKALLAPLLLLGGTAALALAVVRGGAFPDLSGRWGATRVEGARFPKRIVSGSHSATLPVPPRAIASLTVSADEILSHLAAPERIRALTVFADDEAISTCVGFAPRAPRIRGLDPERIIGLEPDLVFVAHYTLESAIRILVSASIPVVRLREAHSFSDVEENVRVVAAAVGEEAAGERVVGGMHERLAGVAQKTEGRPRPRVLYLSGGAYTAFPGSIVDEKIRLAGARNATDALGLTGMKSTALDVLVGLDPDVILVPRWSADATAPVREITETPAFRASRAVREGRVYAVPARDLTSESPDSVAGVEVLARLLHAEAFSS